MATPTGDIFVLSQSQLGFHELDRALSELPDKFFGKYTCDHDSPDQNSNTVRIKELRLKVGVNPTWTRGYQTALEILQVSVLSKPKKFFTANSMLIEIAIVTTQNALVHGTKIAKVKRCKTIEDLSKQVALVGMKVFLKRIPPIQGAAEIHKKFSNCLVFLPVSDKMARMWMNLILQLGGQSSVMFPDKERYEKSLFEDVAAFETYLEEVVAWNETHKVFSE